jgi:hypothetical protein
MTRSEFGRDGDFGPDTLAVRGGLARSGFDETAEALYLTQGYVYATAAQAEAAFATATRPSGRSRSGCG